MVEDFEEEDIGYAAEVLEKFHILTEMWDSDAPLSQRDISDRCGISKSTAHRNVKSLIDKGILRKENGGYVLTDIGEVVADETARYVSRIQKAKKNPNIPDFVLDTGLEIEHVVDGKVTRSSRGNPLAPLSRLAEVTKKAEKAHVMTNSVAPESLDAGLGRVLDGEQDIEVVVGERVLESMLGTGWLGDKLLEAVSTENLRIWICEDLIPHQICVIDSKLCYSIENESGMPVALLETENDEAIRWAKRVFEKHREEARRLRPSEIESLRRSEDAEVSGEPEETSSGSSAGEEETG
jgi:predicted transcriptional regulator